MDFENLPEAVRAEIYKEIRARRKIDLLNFCVLEYQKVDLDYRHVF